MNQEEFGRLLQDYMFGSLSAPERQRLAEAALESTERGLEFAQAEEIRERVADPKFRRELIATLRPLPSNEKEPWWRLIWRPQFLFPLAGSAALIVGILVLHDYRSRPESDVAHVTAPDKSGRDVLAREADSSVAEMAALFELPARQELRFELALSTGNSYSGKDTVTATLTLRENSWVYAFVRGPQGAMREVYPPPGEEQPLSADAHSFSFPAVGRMDPETGGPYRLRVFITTAGGAPASTPARWTWLKDNARFEEADYDVKAQ